MLRHNWRDVFVHRLRKYVGAYLAVLGRIDVVTFTAGIGEHAAAAKTHGDDVWVIDTHNVLFCTTNSLSRVPTSTGFLGERC